MMAQFQNIGGSTPGIHFYTSTQSTNNFYCIKIQKRGHVLLTTYEAVVVSGKSKNFNSVYFQTSFKNNSKAKHNTDKTFCFFEVLLQILK